MQPLRKSAPWPPNNKMKMSLVLCLMRLPRDMHLFDSFCRSSFQISHACYRVETAAKPTHLTHSWRDANSTLSLPRKTTLRPQKTVRTCGALAFWPRTVLRTTTACTICTYELKVFRTWGVFVIFILHPTRWLRTPRFSEPTFWPSGASKHWKNTVNRDFSTFSRTCVFFWLFLFWLFLLSACSHHCCCICPQVASLTYRFHSIIK